MDDNRNATTKKLCKSTAWVTPSFGDFGATESVSVSNKPCRTQSKLTVKKTQSFITKFQAMCQEDSSKLQSSTGLTSAEEIGSDRKKPRVMFPAHKLPTRVKTEAQRRKLRSALNSELWSEKYQPKNKEELAVHKKKAEEILIWLKNNMTNVAKHSAPILLLTGPSGIGKTAAVKTLASELRLDLQEWVNPEVASSDAEFQPLNRADIAERSSVDIYTSHSQSTLFSNFLLRANKYCALQLGTTFAIDTPAQNRIILVEEIPYAFYKDQSSLHEILRKYHFCGRCPLVFVLSDTSSSGSSILRLFPKHIMEELKIETISMNPVAPTMMVKVLNRIISQEAKMGSSSVPSAQVVESIAMSSGGDVRAAVNALQFACRCDTADLSKIKSLQKALKKEPSGSKKRLKYGGLSQRDSESNEQSGQTVIIGAKDTTCFLFHALGKIFYFKRADPHDAANHPSLPAHMKLHERDPLMLIPEEVVEKTQVSGDYFNTFLHQNYLEFLSTVEDVERFLEYLSDADTLSSQYTTRGDLLDYSVSVATRGFIHSDSACCHHGDSRKGYGWRPLHKSQWFSVQKQSDLSRSTAVTLFQGYHWDPEILLTELVPFIGLINPTLHDPGQISFVQDLCHFSKPNLVFRSGLERLDEKEILEGEEECSEVRVPDIEQKNEANTASALSTDTEANSGDTLPGSQTNINAVPVESDDEGELIIEDFDD